MASVYSTAFLVQAGVSGFQVLTFEDGPFVYVVRELDIYSGSDSPLSIGALQAEGGYFAYFTFTEGIEQAFHWEGRVVFHPGDTLEIAPSDDTISFDCYVGGYALALP